MATSIRRTIGFLLLPLVLVAVLGVLALGGILSFLTPSQNQAPTQLSSVSVPVQPNSLVWSADGRYLAAGTWGSNTATAASFEVYVIDVAKASILTTLKPTGPVEGLAFSPDGKWLAVATRPSTLAVASPGSELAELVVFDASMFTARLTAKVGAPENGFIELAWAADSKSLCTIEGPVNNAAGKARIRRWDVLAFTEQPVVRALQVQGDAALALSPDGHTLALSFGEGPAKTSLVQLFDLGQEAEKSLRSGDPFWPPRLGFTADGKAVGIFDTKQMLWWNVATGRRAEPTGARFAVQPTGLSDFRSRAAVSPDGAWMAWGYERHQGLGYLSWNEDDKEFGGFIKLTQSASGKSRSWRVSRAQYPPAVAFSPDGTKVAGTVCVPLQPGSRPNSDTGLVLIWAVPN